MKLRTLITAILVLGVLSVAAYFMTRPEAPKSADARLGQPLVPASAIEKAQKLRLADAGKTVELVRQADGTWRVPSYYDMAADFNKLSGLVNNLTEAKVQRLVTSNADRIARLEFKDTKIELLDSADKSLLTLVLGKNPESGAGRFVRFGDEQKAYLASLSAWLDTESKNWANAELLNLKADDIAKIEIPFAEGGPVTVSRAKKEDPWTAGNPPAGQRLKADRISTVLSSLGNIRFSETTATDDAGARTAAAHQRVFKVETFDKKTVTIALGRKPEEKKLKPPAPASLGSVTDLLKKEEKKDDKPLAPEFETIPAGPVFVSIAHSDAAAPVNALMAKRAFQISDYTFTSLPQKADELFEPAPAPATTPAPDQKKDAEDKKPAATK
jgi:hypothetical protein